MQLSLPGFGVNTSPMAVVSLRGQISPVRRRLSFSSDSEGETTPTVDNRVALKRQLLKIQEEQSLKWNFDFVDEQPMSGGRYIWEPTLPDRPSHPLPPPAGIKRSIDNQQQDSTPLCKQLKSDNNLNNTMNNNHRAVVQAKITGEFTFQSPQFSIAFRCTMCLPDTSYSFTNTRGLNSVQLACLLGV